MPPTPTTVVEQNANAQQFGERRDSLDMGKLTIGPTKLTIEEVEAAIKNYYKTSADLKSFFAKEIGDGKGFASHISKIDLNWDNQSKDSIELPKSVVVKISDTTNLMKYTKSIGDGQMGEEFANIEKTGFMYKAHNSESAWYEFSKKHNISLQIAKSLHEHRAIKDAPSPGYIVFEDLSDKGKSASFINGGLNLNQAKEVVNNLAKLHAFCLQNDSWRHPDMSVSFAECLEENPNMFLQCLPPCEELMKKHEDIVGPMAYRCKEMFRDNNDLLYVHNLNKELGLPDILVHGDLWVNNIMFKTDKNGDVTDELLAIIDWQCTHPGCVAEDMARFLCVSMSRENRRNHTTELLKFYYEKLTEYLGHQPPFTYELYEKAYKKCFRFGVNFVVPLMIPLFLTNENLLGENPEAGKKYLLEMCVALMEDLFDMDI